MENFWLTVVDVVYKVASVSTLIFLSWQIGEAKKTNKISNQQFEDKKNEDRIRHQKDEREKAIQMAELYANELIFNITYINTVYNKCGISKYFKDLSYNELIDFDVYELEGFIKRKTSIDELKKISSNIELMILVESSIHLRNDIKVLIKERKEILRLKKYIQIYEDEKEAAPTLEKANNDDEGTNQKKEDMYIKAIEELKTYSACYKSEFNNTLDDTLNKLEYFCMYFNSGVADEETVYQSLHQSFLEMVKIIYFSIASRNKSGRDKYYTNIIKLYKKWSDRYSECLQKEINMNRNNTHEQEEIKK